MRPFPTLCSVVAAYIQCSSSTYRSSMFSKCRDLAYVEVDFKLIVLAWSARTDGVNTVEGICWHSRAVIVTL